MHHMYPSLSGVTLEVTVDLVMGMTQATHTTATKKQ